MPNALHRCIVSGFFPATVVFRHPISYNEFIITHLFSSWLTSTAADGRLGGGGRRTGSRSGGGRFASSGSGFGARDFRTQSRQTPRSAGPSTIGSGQYYCIKMCKDVVKKDVS